MIPVGRERDKRIAELLGYTFKDFSAYTKDEAHEPLYMLFKKDKPKAWMPDYSTNRNDAWELWDIMKENGARVRLVINAIDSNGVFIIIESIRYQSVYFGVFRDVSYTGKDEADAISGAFIKYMEAKK
jgi:hypothetical protein